MHMYPVGDFALILLGAFCLWAAVKAQDSYIAKPAWYGRSGFKAFFLVAIVVLILSVLDLVTFKGAIWQR